jgi:hypothetical protein
LPDIRLDIVGSASREEMETIAKEVSEKLNQHPNKNMLKFIIPQKGFSFLSVGRGFQLTPKLCRLSSAYLAWKVQTPYI